MKRIGACLGLGVGDKVRSGSGEIAETKLRRFATEPSLHWIHHVLERRLHAFSTTKENARPREDHSLAIVQCVLGVTYGNLITLAMTVAGDGNGSDEVARRTTQ